MDIEQKRWLEQYRKHEANCVKASGLPPGKRRDAAYAKLSVEIEALRADPAAVKPATLTSVEETWASLVAACLVQGETSRIWLSWIDNPVGEPPPTNSDKLTRAIKDWQWAVRFETADLFTTPSRFLGQYKGSPDRGNFVRVLAGKLDKCHVRSVGEIVDKHGRKRPQKILYRESAVHSLIAVEWPEWERKAPAAE